ncbi:microviridin/marinostatin family tricyclic proteinase inhibitor [Microbulbifer spongiae]|uniref:Microviridin/marinostatin family tricyclic proteinase inhibitor n=1 Tax=Microbulbifer spongiae TaxID=2944933 RepID=A0ABY9EHF8_9GAMM|nr:microviridin/marinostatin family tricyclic proteinase inhibitor [Microbulbifer sp. MI-G]WKD50301.1 microviridin/marinostatin family tricyclic proteinase inhibitor [Microbulbifer sp. MI-G]
MNNNQPFFAQFMQAQELTTEQTDQVVGGVLEQPAPKRPPEFDNVTQKAPSDNDEGGDLLGVES